MEVNSLVDEWRRIIPQSYSNSFQKSFFSEKVLLEVLLSYFFALCTETLEASMETQESKKQKTKPENLGNYRKSWQLKKRPGCVRSKTLLLKHWLLQGYLSSIGSVSSLQSYCLPSRYTGSPTWIVPGCSRTKYCPNRGDFPYNFCSEGSHKR